MDSQLASYISARWPALVRYATVVTGDQDAAERVVESALAKVAARWWALRDRDDLDGYVRTAIVRSQLGVKARLGRGGRSSPSRSGSLTRPVDIRAALHAMPPQQRAAVVLQFVDDRSEDQTADVLGCSVAAVRDLTQRAQVVLPDTHRLLDRATSDINVTEPNPPRRIDIARSHRQRRWLIGAVILMGLVAAAIVVPISSAKHSHHIATPRPTPSTTNHSPDATFFARGDGSITQGFHSLWSTNCCRSSSTQNTFVDRINPNSGARQQHIVLPGPISQVLAGANRVWTIGATDGGPSQINAINPATGHVTQLHIANPQIGPLRIITADGSAWVTFGQANQVWRLTATATGIKKYVIRVPGGPQDLVAIDTGVVWVDNDYGRGDRLTPLTPSTAGAAVGKSITWHGPLLGAAFSDYVWTVYERFVVPVELPTHALSRESIGPRLPANAGAISVVQRNQQLYVTTDLGLLVYADNRAPVTSRLDQPPASYPDPDIGPNGVVPLGKRAIFSDQYGLVAWQPFAS